MPIEKIYNILKDKKLSYNEKTKQTTILLKEVNKKNIDINTLIQDNSSLLLAAAWHDHLDCAKLFIKAGINLDTQNIFMNTALLYACKFLKFEFIETLIKAGADLDIGDEENETAIFFAVKRKDPKLLSCLLEHKANANMRNVNGETPLILATKQNQVDLVKTMIAHNVNLNFKNTLPRQESALHAAVRNNFTLISQLLIASKAELNIQDGFGNTPTLIATSFESKECLSQLISSRADVNIRNNQNQDPLLYAMQYKSPKLTVKLLTGGAKVLLFHKNNAKNVLNKIKTHDHRDQKVLLAYKALLKQQQNYEQNQQDGEFLTKSQVLRLKNIIVKLEKYYKTHKQNLIRAIDKGADLGKREIPKCLLKITSSYDSNHKDKLRLPRVSFFNSQQITQKLKQEQKLTKKFIVKRNFKKQKI